VPRGRLHSHGEDVDWEKVSSSHAWCPKEMKAFFS
jgi:hypothetical protein